MQQLWVSVSVGVSECGAAVSVGVQLLWVCMCSCCGCECANLHFISLAHVLDPALYDLRVCDALLACDAFAPKHIDFSCRGRTSEPSIAYCCECGYAAAVSAHMQLL